MADVAVREVMSEPVVTVKATDTIRDAAHELAQHHISGAPVIEDERVVGMVTEADLIHAVMPSAPRKRGVSVLDVLSIVGAARPRHKADGQKVADVMSDIVVAVEPDTSIWKAADILQQQGIKRLPVITGRDELVGIVSRADIVRAVARDDATIRRDVVDAIAVLGPEVFEGLDVRVKEGIVLLTGMADRRSTHEIAVRIATRVPGVVDVVDKLEHDFDDTKVGVAVRGYGDPRRNWHAEDKVVVDR